MPTIQFYRAQRLCGFAGQTRMVQGTLELLHIHLYTLMMKADSVAVAT